MARAVIFYSFCSCLCLLLCIVATFGDYGDLGRYDERRYDQHQDKVIEYTNSKKYNKDKEYHSHPAEYKHKHQQYSNKYYGDEDNKYKREYPKEDGRVRENPQLREPQPNPPDHTKYIAMARYVVHQGDWASVATFSTAPDIKGFPFTNVVSMSDGPVDSSTGIPYFYLTPLDFTHKDISKDSRCTVTVSLAETGYCADKKWEADDPRCARVMMSGKIQRVSNTSKEYQFAKNALFTRHPSMADLPEDHHFYVAKLKIGHIVMLDFFGGPKYLEVRDYLSFKPTSVVEKVDMSKEYNMFVHMNSNDLGESVSP